VAAHQQEIGEGLLLLTQICSINLFNSIQRLKRAAVILTAKMMTNKSTKKTKKKKELIAKRPRKRRLHLSSQRSCNESWPKNL